MCQKWTSCNFVEALLYDSQNLKWIFQDFNCWERVYCIEVSMLIRKWLFLSKFFTVNLLCSCYSQLHGVKWVRKVVCFMDMSSNSSTRWLLVLSSSWGKEKPNRVQKWMKFDESVRSPLLIGLGLGFLDNVPVLMFDTGLGLEYITGAYITNQ